MSGFHIWSRAIVFAAAILLPRPGFGAPALTTVQDVLYRADGTRFTGTLYISWTNFQSGDATIPVQGLTVPVTNGALKVQLIPTTIASPGANYSIRYSSQGKFQFTETWAVPPSTVPLRVRDVRVGTGSVVGPPPSTTQVLITDVTGLSNELAIRTPRGPGFQPSRAAVINSSGLLDAASGTLTDCVRVDGSSGPCGSGGGSGGSFTSYSDAETPAGIVDGVNAGFSLQRAPSPAGSLSIFRNGMLQKQSLDYTLSASTLAFASGAIPQPGDVLAAFYRIGDPTNPLSSFTSAEVVCSSPGVSTSSTTTTTLATCTIPSGLLQAGDRIELRFDYAHSGGTSPFNAGITWGASTILSRSVTATEPFLTGRGSLGVHGTGAQWNSESWGSATGFAVAAGNASDSNSSPLTLSFTGQLSSASGDTLALRNFAVIRYPAQANP